MKPEDLSDEQIDQLLRNAEARLGGNVGNKNERWISTAQRGQAKVSLSGSRLDSGTIVKPYVTLNRDIAKADAHRLLDDRERRLSSKVRLIEDSVTTKKKLAESRRATAGSSWFNLPRTVLTSDLKRDLQLLKMRSVLNPKRHYKKDNGSALAPEFSQVGTIVEGPTEFFSARVQNRDRTRTLMEEVMVGEAPSGRFKSKYNELQSDKTSGKKAHYKALKAKRTRGVRS